MRESMEYFDYHLFKQVKVDISVDEGAKTMGEVHHENDFTIRGKLRKVDKFKGIYILQEETMATVFVPFAKVEEGRGMVISAVYVHQKVGKMDGDWLIYHNDLAPMSNELHTPEDVDAFYALCFGKPGAGERFLRV